MVKKKARKKPKKAKKKKARKVKKTTKKKSVKKAIKKKKAIIKKTMKKKSAPATKKKKVKKGSKAKGAQRAKAAPKKKVQLIPVLRSTAADIKKPPALPKIQLRSVSAGKGAKIRASVPLVTDFTKHPEPADIEKIVAMISDATTDYAATEATKFDIGLRHDGAARFEQELPMEYGKDRVILLAVDPNFVFTYWEIREESLRSATEHVGSDSKLTLRFYDVGETLTPEQSNFWDIEVFDRLGNWYLKLSHPDQRLCIDIGMKNQLGHFHRITRSNFIRLPSQSLAKPGPIKWMIVTPEGDKIVSDVEEYTDADLVLLKKILGPYFFDLLMRGRLASIAGSSVEAVFYDVEQLKLGALPSSGPPWTRAR